MRRWALVSFACLLLAGFGCVHGRVSDGAFRSDDYGFSVELPGAPYERITPRGALAALTDPDTGVSFAVAASPDSYTGAGRQDRVLDYAARELMIFLEKKEYRTFEDATLGGAPAKHVVVTGLTEGVELVVSAYVTRYNGAVYDVVLWAPPGTFEAGLPAFQRMVETFTFFPETGR